MGGLNRRLDESLKAELRVRAAGHGRSMEAEEREILGWGFGEAHEEIRFGRIDPPVRRAIRRSGTRNSEA